MLRTTRRGLYTPVKIVPDQITFRRKAENSDRDRRSSHSLRTAQGSMASDEKIMKCFQGAEHLRQILEEAETIASDALAANPREKS